MNLSYLSIGTNLGNKLENIKKTIDLIQKNRKIMKISSIYKSKSWGYESENDFYNIVLSLQTNETAFELLETLNKIEKTIGRTKKTTTKYSDRIIDIDILFFNNEVIEEKNLIIPHKLLHKRDFVLQPFNEIAPELIHPLLKKTIAELLEQIN